MIYKRLKQSRGSGIISNLLDARPKILNDLIKIEGNAIIEKIDICREPISIIFEKLLSVFSIGEIVNKMKNRDYDRLFHLYVVVYLNNGSVYRIEKNQRINVIKYPKKDNNTECKTIDLKSSDIRFGKFITEPEKDMDGLYRYNAFLFNCQNYIKRLLNTNGINEFNDFILQKVDDLAPPFLKKIVRGITDMAAISDWIYRGGGKKNMDDDILYEKILNSSI